MRARGASTRTPPAHRLLLASAAWLFLGQAAAQASAQYEPEPDDIVIEETQEPSEPLLRNSREVALPINEGPWANTKSLNAELPDPARCVPGILRAHVKIDFLNAFNALRALHGLAPVRYNASADQAVAEAALLMAANNALSHDPPPSWACWTAAGAAAAGSSNLLGGVSSPYLAYEDNTAMLAEWLIEGDGDELGHRRWLLDPYLDQTTLGRVITVQPGGVRVDSAAMKVFDFPQETAERHHAQTAAPSFVAWPQGDYPAYFFSPHARLSFSASQDADVLAKVDFADAKVIISDLERSLPVRDQRWDNEEFGVSNCLSWRVDGIVPGKTYHVTINGIRGAPKSSYTYAFRITD